MLYWFHINVCLSKRFSKIFSRYRKERYTERPLTSYWRYFKEKKYELWIESFFNLASILCFSLCHSIFSFSVVLHGPLERHTARYCYAVGFVESFSWALDIILSWFSLKMLKSVLINLYDTFSILTSLLIPHYESQWE